MRLRVFTSLGGYQRDWIRGDLIAGLTVWAVLVPEALAYASIAGVSPVVGLYAAPAALVLYALFGSSKHLIVGPMAATAALSAAAIAQIGGGADDASALTAALAIVTGFIAILAALLRLGFLANFISEPVMKGFIVGLALTIMAGQLPKLFGTDSGSGNFFEKLWDLATKLGQTSGLTLIVGVASLVLVLLLRRVAPKAPGTLVVVLLGIMAVVLFGLDDRGVAIVGPIPSGLPAIAIPSLPFSDYLNLAGPAVGIMLVGFAEGLGAAKTYAARNHYEIDVDRELLGLGTANAAAGLVSGMVVNGSLSKTAVNGDAGARSEASGIVAAALTVLTLLFLTGLFQSLPEPVLAAVVIAALIELVDVRGLASFYRASSSRLGRIFGPAASRPDFIAALAAFLGVLVFDTLPGLFIGIAASMLLLIYRASRPYVARLGKVPGTRNQYADVARHPENTTVPGVVVLRVEGGLFFANAEHVRQQIVSHADEDTVRAIVLDTETVPFVDVTASRMLAQLSGDLERRRVTLAIARELGQVRDVLRRADGREALRPTYPTVQAAVDALHAEPSKKGRTSNDP